MNDRVLNFANFATYIFFNLVVSSDLKERKMLLKISRVPASNFQKSVHLPTVDLKL